MGILNQLATTFKMSQEMLTACSYYKLLHFPKVSYLEMREFVERSNKTKFIWHPGNLLRDREIYCTIVFPDMPSVKDEQNIAQATVLCSIRESQGRAWAVFSPMFEEVRTAGIQEVQASANTLFSSCLF